MGPLLPAVIRQNPTRARHIEGALGKKSYACILFVVEGEDAPSEFLRDTCALMSRVNLANFRNSRIYIRATFFLCFFCLKYFCFSLQPILGVSLLSSILCASFSPLTWFLFCVYSRDLFFLSLFRM